MKTPEDIKKGLEACGDGCCSACTYWDNCDPDDHHVALVTDALAYIEQLEEREWNVFDLLSSVWFGKQYYSKQDDGTVYSRKSCEYLAFDQAIDEFANAITVAGDMDKRMEDDLK